MDSSSSSSSSTPLERLNDASHRAVELANRFAAAVPPRSNENDSNEDSNSNSNSSSNNNNDNNNSRNRNASNPWVNPQSIQDELIAARRDLANAWEDLRSIKHSSGEDHCDESSNPNNDNDNSNSNNDDDEDKDHLPDDEFIALYVDTITDAFGDVLGQMQDNGENNSNSSSSSSNNNIDVELLVDCLQSGIDLLDPDQRNRKSYFASLGHNENETETVHEARQRSLGYLPVVS